MGTFRSLWRSTAATVVIAILVAIAEVVFLLGVPSQPVPRWYPLGGFLLFAIFMGRALYVERDKVEKPDVALAWDWSDDQKKLSGLSDLSKSIVVHNRSTEWIYNVKIHSVKLIQEMTFELINEIGPQKRHVALARWNGRSSLTTDYVYFFEDGKNEIEASNKKWKHPKTHNRGLSEYVLRIPMRVTYEANNRKWKYRATFVWDVGAESLFEKQP